MVAAEAVRDLGRIDIVLANAGIGMMSADADDASASRPSPPTPDGTSRGSPCPSTPGTSRAESRRRRAGQPRDIETWVPPTVPPFTSSSSITTATPSRSGSWSCSGCGLASKTDARVASSSATRARPEKT